MAFGFIPKSHSVPWSAVQLSVGLHLGVGVGGDLAHSCLLWLRFAGGDRNSLPSTSLPIVSVFRISPSLETAQTQPAST